MLQSLGADAHLVALKGSISKKKDRGRSNLLKLLEPGGLSWIPKSMSQIIYFGCLLKMKQDPYYSILSQAIRVG